jgi:hypothetical protein
VGQGRYTATIQYSSSSTRGPVVSQARLVPFDANSMKIVNGQEVASPVLDMGHTPGVEFSRQPLVLIPIETAKLEWLLAYEAQKKLAALLGTSLRHTSSWANDSHHISHLESVNPPGTSVQYHSLSYLQDAGSMSSVQASASRSLLQQLEQEVSARVEMMAVWYNNQTNRWTQFDGTYISEVCMVSFIPPTCS